MTLTKVSFNVTAETKTTMEDIKKAKDIPATEQIKKGIGLLKYVLDAQDAGNEFRMYTKGGGYRVVEIIL